MALISQPIVSLLNGVSQQPASLRHPSQAEAQVNLLSSLAVGLQKRPPVVKIAKLVSTPLPAELEFWHTINRSSTRRYEVSVENGDIRVFDLADGAEKTVSFAEHRFFSLDDSTTGALDGVAVRLYVPTGITTADFATSGMEAGVDEVIWEESTTGAFAGEETTKRTDSTDTDAAVTITSGRWYRATHTGNGSGTVDAWFDWGDTSYLQATDPSTAFRLVTIADYTFIGNNTITVAADTSAGSTNTEVLTDTVQVFGDLPSTMPGAGLIYRVAGDEDNAFDDYYVKVDADNKVYEEYKKPGQAGDALDQSTMPHTLVDNLDGTFTYANGVWDPRDVGDSTDTNKAPVFVGEVVTDVYFFRNRFGVTAGESTSLSRIGTARGGYFNFWRETVTAQLDTDPIHMDAPHEHNSTFIAAVPFDESLVLFSEEAQFVLNSEGTLTPASARIDVTTEFTASGNARPVGVGQNVYFPVDGGDHVGIREYFVEPDTTSNDAANVTAHVPKYIPAGVFKMAGSTNEDLLAILTSGADQRIYMYKFFWDGTTKAQSAWSYWEVSSEDTILNIDFIGPVLYLITERSDGIYLEKISINDDDALDDIGVIVHLDRREALTGVYDSGNNWTTWTMASDTAHNSVVVTGSSFSVEGEAPPLTYPSANTARSVGDWSDGDCWVGIDYNASYTFSEQFQRSSEDVAVLAGRLQLGKWNVRYVDTGFFQANVLATARSAQTYKFTGNVLGNIRMELGALNLYTGTFVFPVVARSSLVAISLSNATWKPSIWLSAQWSGIYSKQAVIQ